MDFLGGGEDFMVSWNIGSRVTKCHFKEDMRDQNSDDLEADERLTLSKARCTIYVYLVVRLTGCFF